MKSIKLEAIFKSIGSETIFSNLFLEIPSGKFFALLGPSGCGKTTLLRMIAGFEEPDSGTIYLGNEDITHLPVNKRNINTVFQNYSLFPHLTVFENIAYALRIRGVNKTEIEHRVYYMLELFGLTTTMSKLPSQLSGGQQQRVAIARAVINQPQVLLLDEPLAALDLKLREKVLLDLIELQEKLATTFIYVTHDQIDALTVADQMAIIAPSGVINQIGTPKEIYEKPKTIFVAKFVGKTNTFEGTIVHKNEKTYIDIDIIGRLLVHEDIAFIDGEQAYLVIRPEKIKMSKESLPEYDQFLFGVIKSIVYHGWSTQYNIELVNKTLFSVFVQNIEYLKKDIFDYDDKVYLYWKTNQAVLLKK